MIPSDPNVAIKEIIGSGPFRFVAGERVPGAQVVYERFDAYVPRQKGKPGLSCGPKLVNFDRVEWHVIPDAATALAAIRNGEVARLSSAARWAYSAGWPDGERRGHRADDDATSMPSSAS